MQKMSDRLSALIAEGRRFLSIELTSLVETRAFGEEVWRWNANQTDYFKWIFSSMNIIKILVGQESHYYQKFPVEHDSARQSHIWYLISCGIAILESLKEELDEGLLTNLDSIVSVDIFTSINEQAELLLNTGYKDAAAVYSRVILETSLKKLCDRHHLTYSARATINPIAELLRSNDILNLIEWRRIKYWADIGNAAAHGNFEEYDADDVKQLLSDMDKLFKNKLSING